jgi:signal peptidase I
VKRTHQYHQVFDLVGFVCSIVTIMLWLVMFIATPIEVTGDSMENNYHEKDKILVWHLFYDVEYFDVVIVDVVDKYDFNEGTEFVIKRVVAVGGDKITYDPITQVVCRNGKQIAKNVRVDDFKNMLTIDSLDEEYYFGYEGIVPEGYCILLGDNRAVSKDSRSVGLIKEEDILGKCFFRIYPFNAIGLVD